METYYTSIDYKYLVGSVNYGKFTGGFVYAFVKAKDAREALEKFCCEMESLDLEVTNVEYISIYDDILWDNETSQVKFDGIADQASQTDQVICDLFYAYESE